MDWVYLSPHFDDVALSCGGLVWEQSQSGHTVSVWTICAGEPLHEEPSLFARSLHQRWGTERQAVDQRREEDRRSCQQMGALYHHFPIPDCIYRGSEEPLYASEEALFGELHPAEESLVHALCAELSRAISPATQVVSPLAFGHHVDHQLTRRAAEQLGLRLWYYADYPYVLDQVDNLAGLEQQGWEARVFPISAAGLQAWEDAAAAHASQISTFWASQADLYAAIRRYCQARGGVLLWRRSDQEQLF